MKKNRKMIICVAIMAVLCVAYFYYLSRKEPTADSTQKAVTNQEVAELMTLDIDNNYPQSPKEVVKLYVRYAEAYYKYDDITDEQLEKLAVQTRRLFDSELKGTQTDSEYYEALKEEIAEYKEKGRYISSYLMDDSDDVNYTTFQGDRYASLNVTYGMRENSDFTWTKTKFTLRRDDDGRWKILYWELA